MSLPSETDSITKWFVRLKAGDERAATLLWQHYFPRLVLVAQARFDADRDPAYGADDAAQCVFDLLCRGVRQGRYAEIAGRNELWRLLVAATRLTVIDQVRRSQAANRGGHAVVGPIVAGGAIRLP